MIMKYLFSFIAIFLLSISSFAQEKEKGIVVDMDKLSEEDEILDIVSLNGWVMIKASDEDYAVSNFSNKDYVLLLFICKDPSTEPQFLVEYSKSYRDSNDNIGSDFIGSNSDHLDSEFILDGKSFQNPYKNYKKNEFERFIETMKKSNKLTINVYDNDVNDGSKLISSIDFKLENGELLDLPIQCK